MSDHITSARILVIDDDVDLVEVDRLVLEAAGFEVTAAYTAREGESYLHAGVFDLVVMDVAMETPTAGFELAGRLGQDPALRDIPVLMVTAVSEKTAEPFDTTGRGDYAGVTEFARKPMAPAELLERVNRMLQRRATS